MCRLQFLFTIPYTGPFTPALRIRECAFDPHYQLYAHRMRMRFRSHSPRSSGRGMAESSSVCTVHR